MNSIILSIGDELVLGQTVDTNSAWMSKQLAGVGCDVVAHATVGDDQPGIERAMARAASECDVLIISGGLGPTEDDLTRKALAGVMAVPLEMNDAWLTEMRRFFAERKRPMPERNSIQAMIPRGASMIWNTCGTAAGIRAHVGACKVFVVPGVPKEMKAMFQRDVMPVVLEAAGGATILSRTIHTFGVGESALAEMLGTLMQRGRNPSVGTTVSGGVVSLRLNARFPNRESAEREMAATTLACTNCLGDLVYGMDDVTLVEAVAHLLKHSGEGGKPSSVATAESCTGGLLSKMLTDVSGSSAFFKYGWVVYSNEAKQDQLGVAAETLKQYGAVSEPVVMALSDSARMKARATFGIAISGVAGPDGGTAEKPVGTVCIALSHDGGTTTRTFNFPGDREMIRDRSAKMALTMLRFRLLGKTLPF